MNNLPFSFSNFSRFRDANAKNFLRMASAAGMALAVLAAGCNRGPSGPISPLKKKYTDTVEQTFDGSADWNPSEEEITNSIGMKLVLIPAGEFQMGWPSEDHDIQAYGEFGGVQHTVKITRPFYMGTHEVTQAQYQQVMGQNPSAFAETGNQKHLVDGMETGDFPVDKVNWENAMEFCKRLSELPEEKEAGRTYTLPTEAQWEYACRAGTTTSHHTGLPFTGDKANFDALYPEPQTEENVRDSLGRTTSVGQYPANDFGLYDMHGNVWEWCLDSPRVYEEGVFTNPRGKDDPEVVEFVLRGGSYRRSAVYARSDFRNHMGKTSNGLDFGFRVVYQE